MISFLVTAKNCKHYIVDCVQSLLATNDIILEVIVIIDENSNVLINLLRDNFNDSRLIVKKNIGNGKIIGLNYAYSLSSGDYIKCVDADDILLNEYFSQVDLNINFDSHLHSAFIVDYKLKNIGFYSVNSKIFSHTYSYYFENLLSVPKWCWTFNRKIADIVFPLPLTLPFEDVWMGLVIKKYSNKILYTNFPLYKYRQHSSQTFGGLLNYTPQFIKFRAFRMLILIETINKTSFLFENNKTNKYSLTKVKKYYSILFNYSLPLIDLFTNNLSISKKLRLLLMLNAPFVINYLIKIKWYIDDIKNRSK